MPSKAAHSNAQLTLTTLKRPVAEYTQSIIQPLRDGEDALYSRLAMMDDAQRTLDISAFIIRPDNAGYLFSEHLYQAAERGVKIRLLLDDLFNRRTAGKLMALDQHKNIEVRAFNPFSRLSPTIIGFLLDYKRVSRRMHSRMMIADNGQAIIGGRNIADEYFSDNGSSKFLDFELRVEGKITRKFTESFEMYWSDHWSLPVSRISNFNYSSVYSNLLQEMPIRALEAKQVKYPRLSGPLIAHPDRKRRSPTFHALTGFITDIPEKLRNDPSYGPFFVADNYFQALAKAQSNVLIITPYFIPEEQGSQLLKRLVSRGVHVTIVTNSLASTNHVPVHGVYATYRKRLMRAGIEFYELVAKTDGRLGVRDIAQTLHTKLTVIDGQETIITTMNFDPVSIKGNSEISLIVRDRGFSGWILQNVNPIALGQSFRLSLNEKGEITWFHPENEADPIRLKEPGASEMRKFNSSLIRILGLEGVL